ncbi:hypothetical protein HJ474_001351 [Escherichia coli]|nr:hypothetical protein [Escherichia coli]
MKQMSLIEMDGFLKGKCIPRDLKVNETNAEYLVRKFGELESKLETALRECRSAGITIDNLEAKCSALAADNEKAMEAMRQSDAAVKLAHEKFSALAAENAKLKKFCKDAAFDADYEAELGMERGGFSDAINEIKTPATDAFLAEVRAQGVDMAMEHMQSSGSLTFGDCYISLNEFADQLRKGGNQ